LYKIALDRFLYGPAFNFIMMAFVFKARARTSILGCTSSHAPIPTSAC
jgi:hypothetical protein